jgi:hypothetical protein
MERCPFAVIPERLPFAVIPERCPFAVIPEWFYRGTMFFCHARMVLSGIHNRRVIPECLYRGTMLL